MFSTKNAYGIIVKTAVGTRVDNVGSIGISRAVSSPFYPTRWTSKCQVISEKSIIHGRIPPKARPDFHHGVVQYHITLAKALQLKSRMHRIVHDVPHKIIRAAEAWL